MLRAAGNTTACGRYLARLEAMTQGRTPEVVLVPRDTMEKLGRMTA